MPTRRLPTALAFALLTFTLPFAAHAEWDFGEHVWLESAMGLGGFTGLERSTISLTVRSTLGLRVDETSGVELSVDGAFDPLGGVAAGGFAVHYVYFPGTDALRLRAGTRIRGLTVDEPLADICFSGCPGTVGANTLDLGIDLGFASQWNAGPFYVGVEWLGLYQPLVALDTEYVYRRGGDEIGRSPADWRGIELPAEIRILTLLCGLTF